MLWFVLKRQLKKDQLATFSVLRYFMTKHGLGQLSVEPFDEKYVPLNSHTSQLLQMRKGHQTCRNFTFSACMEGRGQSGYGRTNMVQQGSEARSVVNGTDGDALDRELEAGKLTDEINTCASSLHGYRTELFHEEKQRLDEEYHDSDNDEDELHKSECEVSHRSARRERRRAALLSEDLMNNGERKNTIGEINDEVLTEQRNSRIGTHKKPSYYKGNKDSDDSVLSHQDTIDIRSQERSDESNRKLEVRKSKTSIEPYRERFRGNTIDTLNKKRIWRLQRELKNTQPSELARLQAGKVDISQVITNCPKPKENPFLPIIKESPRLQKLVNFGINLSVMQKAGLTDFAMRLDMEKDVLPYALCLKDTGLADDKIAEVINAWPYILQEPLHNIQVRINYLRWKKFPDSTIAAMMLEDPRFLCKPFRDTDKKLGLIQQLFHLSGAQIRTTGGPLAGILNTPEGTLQLTKKYLSMMEFSKDELRKMFVKNPCLYKVSIERLSYSFDYVNAIMEVPLALIAEFPEVLTRSIHTVRERHKYLLRCGRAQFDPSQPNYVSLGSLVNMDDEAFCREVAKTSLEEFDAFLRMI